MGSHTMSTETYRITKRADGKEDFTCLICDFQGNTIFRSKRMLDMHRERTHHLPPIPNRVRGRHASTKGKWQPKHPDAQKAINDRRSLDLEFRMRRARRQFEARATRLAKATLGVNEKSQEVRIMVEEQLAKWDKDYDRRKKCMQARVEIARAKQQMYAGEISCESSLPIMPNQGEGPSSSSLEAFLPTPLVFGMLEDIRHIDQRVLEDTPQVDQDMDEDDVQLEQEDMGMDIANEDDCTPMSVRVMSLLHYQDESHNKKRRWILKWREDLRRTNRKKLEFFIDKYVCESSIREDNSSVARIKAVVQRGLDALYDDEESAKVDKEVIGSSSEVHLDKIYNLSDVRLLRSAPGFLELSKLKSLRNLSSAMSGKHSSSRGHIYIEKQIRKYLEKIIDLFMEKLPEPILKVALMLTDSNSFCINHEVGPDNQSELFSQIPSCRFGAFAQLETFPIQNLQAVHRMLMADCRKDVQLLFQRACHGHGFTINLVMKHAKNLLSHVKVSESSLEGIERSPHAVNLSARDLYGDDGGFRHLLWPLSTDLEALQDCFIASLSHLKKMEVADLEKVHENTTGMPEEYYQNKYLIMYQIFNRILVGSLPCDYMGVLRDPIARPISVINVAKERDFESSKSIPKSGNVTLEPIKKEIARCLSASLEVMMCVLSESLEDSTIFIEKKVENEDICALENATSHDEQSSMCNKPRGTGMDHTDYSLETDGRHISSQRECLKNDEVGIVKESEYQKFVERKIQQVEVEGTQRNMIYPGQKECIQKVERSADEVSAIACILVGRVLKKMSRVLGRKRSCD